MIVALPGRVLLLTLLCAGGSVARAQGRGGGGGGPMGGGGMGMPRGGMGSGMGMPERTNPGTFPHGGPPPGEGNSPGSSMHGGLQLGPPGRWWDDKKFAKSLGLNGDQQKRMDTVFGQNRDALLSRNDALQKAEGRLEALTRSGRPTEAAVFTEIERVAQARTDLEKTYAHMLLQLRDEMTAEQVGRLDDHR